MTAKTIEEAVEQIEIDLGLSKGFFSSLLKEDDWSFIIKVHALLEAAISDLLVTRLNEKSLWKIFSRLEMSNNTIGKLAFCKELNILDSKYRSLIRNLSEIRNSFVHHVTNANKTIADYTDGLSKEKSKAFFSAILLDRTKDITFKGKAINSSQFAKDNAKLIIWISVMELLGDVHINKAWKQAELDKLKVNENAADLFRLMFKE